MLCLALLAAGAQPAAAGCRSTPDPRPRPAASARPSDAWDLTDFCCIVFEGETHTLRVKARDPAGNASELSDPLTVTF